MRWGNLGASTWRLKTYDLAKSRVLSCSARQTVALQRLEFAIQLAAGGACKLSRNLLSSRASTDAGKRVGGRCRNHYLRALIADHQWMTGLRDPKALSELIGEAAEHFEKSSTQAAADTRPKTYPIDPVYRTWQRTLTASTLAKFTKRKLRKTHRMSNRKGVTPSLVGQRPQTTQVKIFTHIMKSSLRYSNPCNYFLVCGRKLLPDVCEKSGNAKALEERSQWCSGGPAPIQVHRTKLCFKLHKRTQQVKARNLSTWNWIYSTLKVETRGKKYCKRFCCIYQNRKYTVQKWKS